MSCIDLLPLIGKGASADILRLDDRHVLKLFHAGVESGIVRREIESAQRACDEGVPVPRPIGRRVLDGREGIVVEAVDGKPLLERTGLRIGRARDALRKLAAAHAGIHGRSAEGLYHQQHDILHVRIEAADCDEDLKARAMERLYAIERGHRLCHGDFHPGNAIETDRGVVAVDWSSGCAGDPAGDVARTELLLRFGQYGRLLRHFRLARQARRFAADFYLDHYRRITGIALERIAAWRLPVAVSCLVGTSRIHRPALLAALKRDRTR
jgi:aminoglycoside phosphotransferase (APT) family kinase protein